MRTSRVSAALFVFFLFSSLANASLVQMKPGSAVIEKVKIATEAAVTLPEGKTFQMFPYAKGLRKKKVALFWAKVYVAQIFTRETLPPPRSIPFALASLSNQKTVLITLSFLRNVTSNQMKAAFEDSFEENGIDSTKDSSLKPLFEVLGKSGNMKEEQTMAIVFMKDPKGEESIYLDSGAGNIQHAAVDAGTIEKVLKVWFGAPADSGMEILQKQFLGQKED